MARRKMDIKRIQKDSLRHTTFTKRRKVLEKETWEFFEETRTEGAIITFSDAGNCFVFAHPHIDNVMSRYDSQFPSTESGTVASCVATDGIAKSGIVESCLTANVMDAATTEAQKRIGKAVENSNWNEAVGDLGVKELDEVYGELEIIKRELAARRRELIAGTATNIPDGGSSIGSTSA